VHCARDPLPSVKIDAEEYGFREEGEPFQRERHPDDRSGVLHEARKQQSELEGQHRSRDGADREEHGCSLRPVFREVVILDGATAMPQRLGDDHESGHGDANDREHNVECERDPHLRTRKEHIHEDYLSRAQRGAANEVFAIKTSGGIGVFIFRSQLRVETVEMLGGSRPTWCVSRHNLRMPRLPLTKSDPATMAPDMERALSGRPSITAWRLGKVLLPESAGWLDAYLGL
jgi:hypothetical protein